MRRQTKKLCFQFLLYLVSDVGTHSCCEGWAVSCHPPLWSVLGKLNVVKVYIPDQMPAMSELMSAGIPPWWRSMLEQFIGAQTSRCSRKQQRLLFIWCTGVSTSPHQLLAYRGLLPLKGFWVCVQAYGITLSSVLTAKHDSTANFLAGIKL